jgi:hypothetical protein
MYPAHLPKRSGSLTKMSVIYIPSAVCKERPFLVYKSKVQNLLDPNGIIKMPKKTDIGKQFLGTSPQIQL